MQASNEIYALLVKACRGQKIPLAQAQYAATAAAAHPQALANFVKHLNMPQLPLSTVAPLHFKNVHILRDLPTVIAALAAGAGEITLLDVKNDLAISALLSQSKQVITKAQSSDGLKLSLGTGINTPPPPQRAAVTPDIWQQLSDMAAKIYVPETEESRQGGAGAGLTDND